MTDGETLTVRLEGPPEDSPPDTLAALTVYRGASDEGAYRALLVDPVTDSEREELSWYLEHYWRWPYEGFARRGREIEASTVEIGRRLYDALFARSGTSADGVREIALTSVLPRALNVPWELLHDGRRFLAIGDPTPISIVRHFSDAHLTDPVVQRIELPLRVLLVTARPEGTPFVDQRMIAGALLDALQPQIDARAVEVELLRPPTLAALHDRLQREPRVHILHFDGHGVFMAGAAGQGALAFEDDDGRVELVEAAILARVLRRRSVPLAVLTACQSAMSGPADPFSSVAAGMIQGGVDAVVAMSRSVLTVTAVRYVEAFYRAVAQGDGAAVAHLRARHALAVDPRRHLHQRHQDQEGASVALIDWWLPHLYVQRPVALLPEATSRPPAHEDAPDAAGTQPALRSDPYAKYGFTGRSRELRTVERELHRGRAVVLHGLAGAGKTALAHELAEWLIRTRLYARALFVSFEHGGDAVMLVTAIARQLGLAGGSGPEPMRGLDAVRSALLAAPALVIIDNLDTILPAGAAPLSDQLRVETFDVLLELARTPGCGVIITTRNRSLSDARFSDDRQVRYVTVGGLSPEDAYELASRVLVDLGIARQAVPYPELRDLLIELDHHPLAILLTMPALRKTGIESVRSALGALLSEINDDSEAASSRSLAAAMEYCLQHLPSEERAVVGRLVPFQGVGNDVMITAVTEASSEQWQEVARRLESSGLLTRQAPGASRSAELFRFHPLFLPYLRSRDDSDDPELQWRYALGYRALANHLYYARSENDAHLRALEAVEMPNLMHAFDIFVTHGDRESAMLLFDCIAEPLRRLGMQRILEKLAQQVQRFGAPHTDAPHTVIDRDELAQEEYLREHVLAEAELQRDSIDDARGRLTALLARMEALPEGTPRSRGSLEHAQVLALLARCLIARNELQGAEDHLRAAWTSTEQILEADPEHPVARHQRAALLTDIAGLHEARGQYAEAASLYAEAEQGFEMAGDVLARVATITRRGTLAERFNDLEQAKNYFHSALALLKNPDDTEHSIAILNMLGDLALKQEDLREAESLYRRSLELAEKRSAGSHVAKSAIALSIVAAKQGSAAVAEHWLRYCLEAADVPDVHRTAALSNLARLIVEEVEAERMSPDRLTEASDAAMDALARQENRERVEPWMAQATLAKIARLQGNVEEEAKWLRCERESYAAFDGNRELVEAEFGPLIQIAAAAVRNEAMRAAISGSLPAPGTPRGVISATIQRLWQGERDWDALTSSLGRHHALLILRILEVSREGGSLDQDP